MAAVKASLALDCRAVLGESPVALADGRVLFVDINGKAVLGWDSAACKSLPRVATPQMVGCIAPCAHSGSVVAGLEDCIARIALSHDGNSSDAVPMAPPQPLDVLVQLPEAHRGPKKRCNDGKCDPHGRFWVGTMHTSWRDESAPRGALLSLQPPEHSSVGSSSSSSGSGGDGSGSGESAGALEVVERLSGTRLANGLAWSADASRLFFIDSALRGVDCFDYDNATGGISNRRTVIMFADSEPGVPDGMAIDATGKLWVVIGESASVRQIDPEAGVQVSQVKLPVQRPTSCAFGGKDLSELYITTREESGAAASTHAGGLFRAHIPGTRGASFAVPFAF